MLSSRLPPRLRAQAPHTVVRALAHARKGLLAQVEAAGREADPGFPAAFARLVAAIEAGFRHEETLMDSIGFPGVREQRRDNALLLNALHHAAPRVEAGDVKLGREVVAALSGLLSLHRFCGLRVLATSRLAQNRPCRSWWSTESRQARRLRTRRPQ